MSGNSVATPGPPGLYRRAERFFTTDVWLADPERLSWPRALGYHAARVAYAGVRTFFERDLPTRAAALTYYTVLSLVPFLAFAFSVVKGLGAYEMLVSRVILPQLHETFEGNPALLAAIDKVFAFVDATDATSLGALGAGVLVYTSIGLMRNIASGLNALWGAPDQPLLRAVREYVGIIVLAPILLTVAGGVVAVATAATGGAVAYVRESLGLGFVIDVALALAPLVVAFVGLLLLYLILPNLRVRLRSAAVGAVVGALLWYGALMLHVRFQIGVASYNALYSGFGALPIFLVWVYVSWLTVLIGGGVAAGHQNTRLLVQQMRARGADERFCEALAVNVMAHVGRSFLHGEPHWTRERLATQLDVSDQLVEKVLSAMEGRGLVVRAVESAQPEWVLGRDPDTIRVKDILDAMGHQPLTAPVSVALADGLDPRIGQILDALEHDIEGSSHNLGLRELVARTSGSGEVALDPRGGAQQGGVGAGGGGDLQPDGQPGGGDAARQ
jgi:membrane protein